MDKTITGDALANEVRVTIIDADRALYDTRPTGLADVVLAALVAEPETLEELATAIARYDRPSLKHGFLQHLHAGVNEEPWDAGLLLIDLPARLIVADTEPALYQPAPRGYALYCPDPPPDWAQVAAEEIVWVPYELSAGWLFVRSPTGWQDLAAQRRRERAMNPPFDARPVLFDKVTEFIARECLAAHAAGHDDPIAEIHERWLMTPRADLRGQTPRQVLLAQREFIDSDLESRARQWSFAGTCPPALPRESAAYRCAAFGTHANVVYYDLLRHLLNECWARVQVGPAVNCEEVQARLEQLQRQWLKEGGGEFSHLPEWVLEQERLRVPVTASAADVLIDPDCPACQMSADPSFGPMFWHLDGSHMDLEDNWVFSFHAAREDWEAERREWEEMSRKFEAERAQRAEEVSWASGAQIFDDRQPTAQQDDDDVPF